MGKVIQITTARAIYHLPLRFVAEHRAEHYREDGFEKEVVYVMNDDYEGIDWLENNMNFDDFERELIKVKDLDIEEDWTNCAKEIITLAP